jgi:hypothetical protein
VSLPTLERKQGGRGGNSNSQYHESHTCGFYLTCLRERSSSLCSFQEHLVFPVCLKINRTSYFTGQHNDDSHLLISSTQSRLEIRNRSSLFSNNIRYNLLAPISVTPEATAMTIEVIICTKRRCLLLLLLLSINWNYLFKFYSSEYDF